MHRRCSPFAVARRAVVGVAVTVLALILALSRAPVRVDAQSASALQELCLGVVLPLTSDRHIESLRILDALALAAADLNADPTVLPGYVVHVVGDDGATGHAGSGSATPVIDSHGFVRYGAKVMHALTSHLQNGSGDVVCQNGTQVVAVVGDIDDAVCEQMATVSALANVPMVSPGCRDGRFDAREDGVAYPMFARTIPNLLAEADVVKALMAHFAFPELVLWHSDSTVGSALGHSFAGTSFEVVDVPVPYADTGIEVQRSLERILTLRVRLIFVHAEEALGRLMMATARRNGLLNGDYLFLGSSLWTFGSDEAHRVDFNEEERTYLQGVVGISLPTPNPAQADRFIHRLATITPSLYAPFNTQALVSTVWHAYDAVTLLGLAAHNLTQRGVVLGGVSGSSSGTGSGTDSGTLLMEVIRSGGVSFTGVVGDRIRMLPDGGLDPLLAVTNFRAGAFVTVGHWSADGLELTDAIVWPGDNAELHPAADVPRTLLPLHQALPDAGLAVMALLLCASATWHYLIHVNRTHEVIKASSPVFCHLIVGGSTVAYVMCGAASWSFATYCRVVPTLLALAFSTVFAALLAKTYRIHRIFNSEGLKINAPTSAYLLLTTAAVAGYDVLVSAVFLSVDTPEPVLRPTPDDVTTQYPACGMQHATVWLLVFIVPKAMMLAFGAWLAYKVRHLNHNFNEAKYISMALYNVLLLSAILLSLTLTFGHQVNTAYALKTIGAACCAFVTVCILFVPKFWDIYVTKDWIDYHSNSSYISGVLVHKSSKTGHRRTADGQLVGAGAGAAAASAAAPGAGVSGASNNTSAGLMQRKPHSGNNRGSPTPYLHRPTKLPSATNANNANNANNGNGNSGNGGGERYSTQRPVTVPGGAVAVMRPAGVSDSPVRRVGTLGGGVGAAASATPPTAPAKSNRSMADAAPAAVGIDVKVAAQPGVVARSSVVGSLPLRDSPVPGGTGAAGAGTPPILTQRGTGVDDPHPSAAQQLTTGPRSSAYRVLYNGATAAAVNPSPSQPSRSLLSSAAPLPAHPIALGMAAASNGGGGGGGGGSGADTQLLLNSSTTVNSTPATVATTPGVAADTVVSVTPSVGPLPGAAN